MDNIKIDGTVVSIGDLYKKGDFTKRDLVIETDGKYPQIFAIEFVKDKEQLLDLTEVGDRVSVLCNLRGRQWTNPEGETKYFLSLTAWKFDD